MTLTSQVVLSGCGVFDGSEVHEAAYCLLHLSREGANVAIYAPNISQRKVVNHLTGKDEHGEKRNVLVESARIARGIRVGPARSQIKATSKLSRI